MKLREMGSGLPTPHGMVEVAAALDKQHQFKSYPKVPDRKGKTARNERDAHHIRTMTVMEVDPEHLPFIEDPLWTSSTNAMQHRQRGIDPNSASWGFWGDVRSVEDLNNRIANGWPEGVERARGLIDTVRQVVPPPVGLRRRPRWQDQGDEIDMSRVYSGSLDTAWRGMHRQTGYGPRVISVDVAVGGLGFVSADQMFWGGACAIAVSDALEEQGFRVELFATSTASTEENGNLFMVRCRVKRPEDPLDINTVAALTGLAASFRYYHLQSRTRSPFSVGWGFGSSCHFEEPLAKAVELGWIVASDVQVAASYSEETAKENLLAALAKVESWQDQTS